MSSAVAAQISMVIDLGCRLVEVLPVPGADTLSDLILAQRGYFEDAFGELERQLERGDVEFSERLKKSQDKQIELMDVISDLEKKLRSLPKNEKMDLPPQRRALDDTRWSGGIRPGERCSDTTGRTRWAETSQTGERYLDDTRRTRSSHVVELSELKGKLERQVAELQNLRIMRQTTQPTSLQFVRHEDTDGSSLRWSRESFPRR